MFLFTDLSYSLGMATLRWLNFFSSALQALDVPSRANYLTITAAAAGSDVLVASAGTDTNVNIQINPKGTGIIKTPNAIAVGTNSAQSGSIRAPNTGTLVFRRSDNAADAVAISDSINTDILSLGDDVNFNGIALGGHGLTVSSTNPFPSIPAIAGVPTGTPRFAAGFAPLAWEDNGMAVTLYSPQYSRWNRVSAFPTTSFVGAFPFR